MYLNRKEAGRELGKLLLRYKGEHAVVVALPRGGVPVAFEVAKMLDAPLDVCVVRKLGAPEQPELAIGAVTNGEGAHVVLNKRIVDELHISKFYIDQEVAAQLERIHEMERLFRGGRSGETLRGKSVILVDDGLATGATARAALQRLERENPALLALAVPVAPQETLDSFERRADEVVCPYVPENFSSVGDYYLDFSPVSDREVVEILSMASWCRSAALKI